MTELGSISNYVGFFFNYYFYLFVCFLILDLKQGEESSFQALGLALRSLNHLSSCHRYSLSFGCWFWLSYLTSCFVDIEGHFSFTIPRDFCPRDWEVIAFN